MTPSVHRPPGLPPRPHAQRILHAQQRNIGPSTSTEDSSATQKNTDGAVDTWSAADAWMRVPITQFDENVALKPPLDTNSSTNSHDHQCNSSNSHSRRSPSNSHSKRSSSRSARTNASNDSQQNTDRQRTQRVRSSSKSRSGSEGRSQRSRSKKKSQTRQHDSTQYRDDYEPVTSPTMGRCRSQSQDESRRGRSRDSRKATDGGNRRQLRSRSLSMSRRNLRGEGSLLEKLFGDHIARPANTTSSKIRPRSFLTTSVHFDESHCLWITTLNFNQKAESGGSETHQTKNLRAFSYPTEFEARESALCYAPPRMLSNDDFPCCFLCEGKFAVFRRSFNCKNCGVCVCLKCTKNWPAKMIPDTYIRKNEKVVKVCNSCAWLSHLFRGVLLKGSYRKTMAIFETGNINLRCQFAFNKNEESMWVKRPLSVILYNQKFWA